MKNINELRQKKTKMVEEARKFLDEKTKDERKMTEEEKTEYDRKLTAIRDMNDAIKREEELQTEEMNVAPTEEADMRAAPGVKVEIISDPNERMLEDPKGGFERAGHFFRDVIKAGSPGGYESEKLNRWQTAVRTAGYMEEGDLAQGGYTVPTEYSKKLIEKSLETSIVRANVPKENIIPIKGNRIEIPADVDDDHSTDYFGGIIIYRAGEGKQITAKNPKFDMIALTLHHLNGLCYVSNDLLSDSIIAMENYLTRKFGQAISFVEDDDYLVGDGVNKALGCFHAKNPARIEQAAEGSQDADTILSDNIFKMWSRLYPAGHNRCIWATNINTFPQLATMNLTVGVGGAPIWMPAGGISGAPYQTLMGRPLFYSEKMSTLGDAGDIGLVDLSQYYIGEKAGGVKFDSSMHIRFDYDETAFRFVMRNDGQPTWTSTLTPKNGSTLSPFITLAERA